MYRVRADDLRSFLAALLAGCGASDEEADEVADHLVEANLTGHDSHGALRAPGYIEKIDAGEMIPRAAVTIERETPTTAVVDGHWGFGQPASRVAMRLCIEKAKAHAIACVAVRNANHMGRVGYYTGMASREGMVGLGCVNLHGASPCVAPFGGLDRRLPTNPFSIAYPTDREPDFLMDMTSSVVAEGKVRYRHTVGRPVPEGWIIDHAGAPATDTSLFYEAPFGALLPMGGVVAYKGFALSLAIEGLAGGLSGAPCSNGTAERHGNACWYVAIRIDAFGPLADFRRRVGEMIDYVKSSRKRPGVAEILYPGEPEHRTRKSRLEAGIPLDEPTWEWLIAKAARLGVACPKAAHKPEA
ncbi:MAG: Ldh family oxidoreductase [Proteobacteria bacterium]|nr:Ldh family oxidoreductase [Pseudomonadota bacterium]